MPMGRRAGSAFAPARPIFERVTTLPAGIVMSEYFPASSLRSTTASGSISLAGRFTSVTSASLSSARAGTSCVATYTVRAGATVCERSDPR